MTAGVLLTLWAEGEAAAENAAGSGAAPAAGPMNLVFMIFMVLIAMYLLFILPKQSQAKQAKKLIDGLNKNDRVMTTSGIIGLIHSIDKEAGEVVLKVDESNNTKIRFSTGAIYYVFRDKDKTPDGAKDKESGK